MRLWRLMILMEVMLEVVIGGLVMKVDKVADMVVNMKVDKVADMLVTLSTSILVTSSANLSTSMTSTPITTSNIISMSIINCQSLISNVYSRYLHSPGSHQSTRFLESLTHSVTDSRWFYSVS